MLVNGCLVLPDGTLKFFVNAEIEGKRLIKVIYDLEISDGYYEFLNDEYLYAFKYTEKGIEQEAFLVDE